MKLISQKRVTLKILETELSRILEEMVNSLLFLRKKILKKL